jgi:hypothetical protein
VSVRSRRSESSISLCVRTLLRANRDRPWWRISTSPIMISTAIAHLFACQTRYGGSASVDVNTQTGYKFIDGGRECGGMRAPRRPNTADRRASSRRRTHLGSGCEVFGKSSPVG